MLSFQYWFEQKKIGAEIYDDIRAKVTYVIDPDDKHHLLVDEEATQTVRLIFQYACDRLGAMDRSLVCRFLIHFFVQHFQKNGEYLDI